MQYISTFGCGLIFLAEYAIIHFYTSYNATKFPWFHLGAPYFENHCNPTELGVHVIHVVFK